MLQRIRDEAHRFAITYHRQLRGKQATVSMLDQIPGVGKTRRTALLKHFNSVEEMKAASPEELAKAPGMNKTVAQAIYNALREDDSKEADDAEGGEMPEPSPSAPKGDAPPEERFMTRNVIGRRNRTTRSVRRE
jgi:excinuclease ABC subunit C